MNKQNSCQILKKQRPELETVPCCRKCHKLLEKTEEYGFCCTLDEHLSLYKPTARKPNPLRS